MRYAAILFDLDGTLVDTVGLWGKAYLHMLRRKEVEITDKVFYEEIYIRNAHLDNVLERFGVPEDAYDECRKARDLFYCDILRSEASWIEGAKELVEQIVCLAPVGMVTGSWKSYVDAIDERLSVTDLFQTVVVCDDTPEGHKPKPDPLLLCATQLEVAPEDCLYIGDQQFDVDAAKAAGMESCIVPGEFTPESALRTADFTVGKLLDIIPLLSRP